MNSSAKKKSAPLIVSILRKAQCKCSEPYGNGALNVCVCIICIQYTSVHFLLSIYIFVLHFHLLLENTWLDFNQTWQESSLGVGDSNLFKWYLWPTWGPKGRGPKGQSM